jgi:MFS family permease
MDQASAHTQVDARRGLGYGRDFALYATGQAVSIAGDRIATITFVFLVLQFSGSFAPALALFYVSRVLPTLVTGLLVGVLTDRVDRRKLMIGCDAGRALLVAGTPLAVVHGLWTIYPIVVALYALTLTFDTSARAALPDIIPEDRMMGANSVIFRMQTAADVAYALGGFLVFAVGVKVPFLIDAATFVFSAFMIRFMRLPRHSTGALADMAGFVARIRAGMSYLFGNPFLRNSTVAYTFASVAIGAGFVITPLYASGVLGHGAGLFGPLKNGAFRFGMMEVALGLGAFFGGTLTVKVASRWPRGRMFAAGLTATGAAQFLLALTDSVYAAVALLALSGFFMSFFVISALTLLQALTPSDIRGRVVAGRTVVIQSSWALGSALAGVALLKLSVQPLWAIEATLFVIASLFIWVRPDLRSQR